MKKFLLMLACAAAVNSASALELSFWLGNQKINPGETVQFSDVVVDTYDTYKEVTMKPALYLQSDIYNSNVVLTATCTSGQSIQMCTNGVCRGGETVTMNGFVLRAGQKFDFGFDYIAELELTDPIPTVVTTITAEDPTKAGSKVEFVIEMSDKDASIKEVTSTCGVKVVNGGIEYDTDATAQLHVTNILGINYFSARVSGHGNVALPAGLYIYKLGEKSGKIYVK